MKIEIPKCNSKAFKRLDRLALECNLIGVLTWMGHTNGWERNHKDIEVELRAYSLQMAAHDIRWYDFDRRRPVLDYSIFEGPMRYARPNYKSPGYNLKAALAAIGRSNA